MAASANDYFQLLGGSSALVNAPKVTVARTAGGTTLTVDNCNWDQTTGKIFATYQVDTSGNVVDGTQIMWKGVVTSSTAIGSMARLAGATDAGNAIGDYVELLPASAWGNNIATGLLVEHNQDGTHGAMTADSLTVDGALAVTGTTTLTGALTVKSYDGWISSPDTWVYASATTFTIAGVDRTAQFPVGTKIKLTQTTAKYFYVTAAAFSTNTTVTVTGGSDYTLANAAITSPNYSYDATPQGFPKYFNWTPSYTNLNVGSTGTTIARFSMNGGTVHLIWQATLGGSGISVGAVGFSPPVNASFRFAATDEFVGTGRLTDANSADYPGFGTVASATLITMQSAIGTATAMTSIASTSPFTWAAGDAVSLNGTYEAA